MRTGLNRNFARFNNSTVLATRAHTEEKSSRVMGKVTDYAQFSKLRLASLVVFSAVIGYVIAINFLQKEADWLEMVMLFIGGFLVTGSSNGFNQVIEREYDKLMTRTQTRPIPQDRMSVSEGIIFASIMGISGIFILGYFLNPLSAILGATALFLYVAVYTPLKQKTPLAVFVGAFPGAIPPLLGWVAATDDFGYIGTHALMLFAVQFMWQFPHFWAIAWVSDEDYRKAGFRLLPSGHRDKRSAFQILLYTVFLIPVSVLPVYFGMSGSISLVVVTICGILFLLQAWRLFRDCEVKSASRLMFGSFIYLPVVQLAYLFG